MTPLAGGSTFMFRVIFALTRDVERLLVIFSNCDPLYCSAIRPRLVRSTAAGIGNFTGGPLTMLTVAGLGLGAAGTGSGGAGTGGAGVTGAGVTGAGGGTV